MRITNKSGLPEALVRAIQNDPYDKGDSDYTATSLLKPARIVALEARHRHEIEDDAEDGLYRLYGQVAHGIIERANMADLAEKRFFMEVSGKKISAQIDTLSIENGTLSDFKFTTAWGFKSDKDPKPEWVAQLNIQLELLRQNGLDASKLQIIGLLRDWQIRDAKNDPSYPQTPVAVMPIPMWSREQTIAFIKMRIAAHEDAKTNMPECSKEERWAKPDTFAVMKKGAKRATSVQVKRDAAEQIAATLGSGAFVQDRPGESVRCSNYCSVAKFCTQFKRLTQTDESSEESA